MTLGPDPLDLLVSGVLRRPIDCDPLVSCRSRVRILSRRSPAFPVTSTPFLTSRTHLDSTPGLYIGGLDCICLLNLIHTYRRWRLAVQLCWLTLCKSEVLFCLVSTCLVHSPRHLLARLADSRGTTTRLLDVVAAGYSLLTAWLESLNITQSGSRHGEQHLDHGHSSFMPRMMILWVLPFRDAEANPRG